jgi:predicted RNA-binding Zn-ribbon protein involved in translation (DUF1610 family)
MAVYKKDFSFQPCPACGKTGILRKSRTKNLQEYSLKKFLQFGFYRCRECGWRGKRFSIKIMLSLKYIAIYIFIAVIFAGVSWWILIMMFK